MNLQSNALKFTKEGGTISIFVEFIRGIYPGQSNQEIRAAKQSKLAKLFKEDLNSDEVESDEAESQSSEARNFDANHRIDEIFEPLEG